jgi:hypothetical protein
MNKSCKKCEREFTIHDRDREFYEKFQVPPPTFCPSCREQRRLSFRNEKHLYKRKCDCCGEEIVSIYRPDSPYAVYCADCWWSDAWNPLKFGLEFDFSRGFFEQFGELLRAVPRLALINRNSTNSEYTNICEQNKNCYLLVESSNNEDCYHGYWLQKCENCTDCAYCNSCTLCLECENCDNCYDLNFSQNCQSCSSSSFLKNCIGCKDCLGCVNLHQKQYYIFNQPCSKEEYEQKIKLPREELEAEFKKFCTSEPQKHAEIIKSEECIGTHIKNSKDCFFCFHAESAEHCRYARHVWRNSKFVMDSDTVGMNSELAYECINTAINSYNNRFCSRCWTVSDCCYSNECDNSNHLFGCIGLNRYKYCILNKQYSKEEYEKLMARIIEHMTGTGEWGEFFPAQLSPFDYEESAASEFYPLK